MFTGPSMEDGVLLVNETDAIPGAADMDLAMAGPSKSGAPGLAVPESAANLPINADIFGSRFAWIVRSACPSPVSDPLICEAQDEKAGKNAAVTTARNIFFIIMFTITKINANGNIVICPIPVPVFSSKPLFSNADI
jgi:hypothetical protein